MRPEPSTGGPAASRTPRRILVANTAHLGDLVLATSVLPALKSAHPEAEIGFLCGGWNQPLAEGHPLVRASTASAIGYTIAAANRWCASWFAICGYAVGDRGHPCSWQSLRCRFLLPMCSTISDRHIDDAPAV